MTTKTPLRVRELPITERPRERLKTLGPSALSSAELLAIIIGSGNSRHSAIELAHDVLARSGGSLRRLASQPLGALTALHGLGGARAVAIYAALELGRRSMVEVRDEGLPVRDPRDVFAAYAARLEDLPVEEFHVAILDGQHRIDRDILVSRGTLNSSLVHPREVFRDAIAERAAAIILIHNHPSGDPTPSPDDQQITEDLVAAGRLLGIQVTDHVIVGRGRYLSFAEAGLL
jgi:DNA repair protein RadC